MEKEAAPQQTWAMVVGVEQYAAGADWNLNGPVNDAVRFIRWLRTRGVPAEQIVALLSPLEVNRPVADELAGDPDVRVAWKPATEDAIYQAIERIRPRRGDLLYFFLGGHGVMIEGERFFLAADATSDNLRNLWLDDALKALRTTSFSGFDRQVIVADACADYVLRADLQYTPPKRTLPKGDPASPDQFVLHAAADGERAGNDPIERAGHFSRVVLAWLEKSGGGQWPPDPGRLADHVKAHFNSEGRNRAARTPIVVRWRGGQGDEDDWVGSTAEFTDRMRLIREVRMKLNPIQQAAEWWARLYGLTARYLNRGLPETLSRDQMLRRLAAANAFDSEGREMPKPLFEFVRRAAVELANQPLQDWVDGEITNKLELENLKKRLAEEPDRPVYHLMIELAVSGSEKRPFAEAFGWALWCGVQRRGIDRGVAETAGTPADLSAGLAKLIGELRSKYAEAEFHLEFFVSREHLSLDFDRWTYRGAHLGLHYPVSVRAADPAPAGERKRYVEKLRGHESRWRKPDIQWLPHRGLALSPIFSHPTDCRAIFGFSAPVAGQEPIRELLETLLDCGAPFMLWPREAVKKKPFTGAIEGRCAAGPLDRVPQHIYDYRYEQSASPLTLYWDDPARALPAKFDPAV